MRSPECTKVHQCAPAVHQHFWWGVVHFLHEVEHQVHQVHQQKMSKRKWYQNQRHSAGATHYKQRATCLGENLLVHLVHLVQCIQKLVVVMALYLMRSISHIQQKQCTRGTGALLVHLELLQ